MSDRQIIEDLFLEAVGLSPDQRSRLLDQRCGDDSVLRAAVEQLIAADQQAGDGEFLRADWFGEERSPGARVDDPDPSAPDETERFRILHSYRKGGLGEVLVAHDRQLDRDVAIKQIQTKWRDSVEARQRFIQEAKVTGRLEHPGIVPVYAMGIWPDGQHYYAMRFIQGDTLQDAIATYHHRDEPPVAERGTDVEDAKGMQLRELLSRFVDVCNTIEYAHSKQVLHRDIKPSNIMVGPYGETLVVDWGLAKLLDDPAGESMTADLVRAFGHASGSTPTHIGGTVGTPQYMSPEQAMGKLDEIGTRTDVYLLGATLYQILTGRPPHQADSISALLQQVGRGEFTRPRDVVPGVAPPLESICLKAMATDSTDRYADPHQIAADVNRWMADQAVSVHNDSASVRLNRWMRRHRTATSTIAVATVLLLIGGVLGTILWNIANVRKFQAQEERRTRKLELEIKDRQRIAELTIAATAAEALAGKEIARDRFSSALDVLSNVLPAVESEPKLSDQVERIRAQVERLGAVVAFYRLADEVEQQNILSRDTKALMACTRALKALGIWDQTHWWTVLPDQDLSPNQIDTLRWDVYQQLMLMDAMLIKSMGNRLASKGGWGMLLDVGINATTTNRGVPEANAALIVSDRVDRFRLAESTRLYRSFARWRINFQTRLQGQDLGPTRNSADAHSIAVLCLIASLDPEFRSIFSGYNGDDPLLAAREMFGRSAALRPTYYGAHLGLGQIEYLIAKRQRDLRWEDLAPSLRAFSQCITLLPGRCFAYADRSSIYRMQALLIAEDDRYDAEERAQRVAERLQWSLADAEHAMEFYDEHPWVGWQVGQTYWELRQLDRALDLWIRTALDVYACAKIEDTTFVGVDDARGRGEIGDWLDQHLQSPSPNRPLDRSKAYIALAAVRLNQARPEEALDTVESALALDPDDPDARAIRGMVLLGEGAFQTAMLDFQAVHDEDPRHPLAAFGLARCLENRGQLGEAYALYGTAESVALTGENQAAAELGRCRTAALSGNYDDARQAIQRAVSAEPACDIRSTVRLLTKVLIDRKRAEQADSKAIAGLSDLLRSVSQLPRASNIEAMPRPDSNQPIAASLLNGGFELGSMRYWNAPSGAEWETAIGFESAARVTDEEPHSGVGVLRIDAITPASSLRPDDRQAPLLARTGQIFSVVAGQRYELVCWARAQSLDGKAIRIIGPDENTLIEFDGGSYPWRRVTSEFRLSGDALSGDSLSGDALSGDSAGRPIEEGTIVPFELQIVASGGGTIWLDDLSCVSIPASR